MVIFNSYVKLPEGISSWFLSRGGQGLPRTRLGQGQGIPDVGSSGPVSLPKYDGRFPKVGVPKNGLFIIY